MRSFLTFSFVLLMAAFLISGCGSAPVKKDVAAPPPPAKDPRSYLTAEISVPKLTYNLGDVIPIKLSVANSSAETLRFQFPTPSVFDIEIKTSDSKSVQSWGKNKPFLQKITYRAIPPGTEEIFTWQWSTDDASLENADSPSNRSLPPGTYMLYGYLRLTPLLASKPVLITLNAKPKP